MNSESADPISSPEHPDSASSEESGLHNLWIVFAQSVRDNVIAEVVVQALRFGGLIILARALRPGDFGLFRVMLVACTFALLFTESGIPDALIQRKVLTATHQSTAWFMTVLLACVSSAALYLVAPAIASVMKMPGLVVGLRLLCIPIFLEGTAVTANARLRRELRFGILALADVVAESGFLVTSLVVLSEGHPRLSLAAGLSARYACHAATIWIAQPYLPTVTPRLRAARDLARFSSTVTGARLIYTLSFNADFLLVGRLLGSSALGFYSMAWDLLRFIPDRLYKVAGRVTLPAFCRLQDDDPSLQRAYRNFFRYLCRIVIPIVGCASIAAPELIGFVYGAKWMPAALPMRLLAPGLILMGLRCGIGSIYYTKDHPSFDIYLHSTRLIFIIITVSLTAAFGLSAVSTGMSIIEGAVSIAGQWMACALIGLGIIDLVHDSGPGVVLAILCAAATIAGKTAANALNIEGVLMIVLITIPPAIVFAWREFANVSAIVAASFGSAKAAPIDLSQEQA